MHAIAWLVPEFAAAVFAVTGAVFLAGLKPLSDLLVQWGYGRHFNRVFGGFLVLAAIFLATPQLRLWGVVLAGFILSGTTVLLLARRQYLYAVPGILLLGTLPFALAAS
jgi:hypothetical protein